MRDADHHSSFLELISKPLKSSEKNRGCKLPRENETMTVSIEPCFTDFSTSVGKDAKFCPDVPSEYYKYNGRQVTSIIDIDEETTVPVDRSQNSYISGDPIEFHIISIGRHYVFGYGPEDYAPETGASNVSLGLPIKDFIFRTLPLNAHDFSVLNKNMSTDTLPTGNQCPLEIQFADDRTVHMSLQQQYENIYVLFSRYYSDLGGNAIRQGRGCYMCYKMNGKTDAEAIKNHQDDWLSQYHSDCVLPAFEYAASYEPTIHSTSDVDIEELVFPNLKDIQFKRDVYAGVYTMYPYVDIDQGIKDKKSLRSLLEKQLRYILDPQYHVTVEVVGMRKGFGSRLFRNTHGRLKEKNLVRFNPELKSLYGSNKNAWEGSQVWRGIKYRADGSFEIETDRKHVYVPRPNKCLVSYADYSVDDATFQEGLKNMDDVLICIADIDNITVKEHKLDPVNLNLNMDFEGLTKAHFEGDGNIREAVTNSLRKTFDFDYCFHKPAQMRFTVHFVTSCSGKAAHNGGNIFQQIGNAWDDAVSFAGSGQPVWVRKTTEKTFDFSICDYEGFKKIWDSLKSASIPNTIDEKLKSWDSLQSASRNFQDSTLPHNFVPDLKDGYYSKYLTDFIDKLLELEPEKYSLLLEFNKLLKTSVLNTVKYADYNCFSAEGKEKYAVYGISGPSLVNKLGRCPYKGSHTQIRIIPTSNFTSLERETIESDRSTCPPNPCGKSCISRFSDTAWFREFMEIQNPDYIDFRNKYDWIDKDDLPIRYLDPNLTSTFIQDFKDGPYKFYCEEVRDQLRIEKGKLSYQYTTCNSADKLNSCFNSSTFDPAKCTDKELHDGITKGGMPQIFREWTIEVLNKYISDFGQIYKYTMDKEECMKEYQNSGGEKNSYQPPYMEMQVLNKIHMFTPYTKYGGNDKNKAYGWFEKDRVDVNKKNSGCGDHSFTEFYYEEDSIKDDPNYWQCAPILGHFCINEYNFFTTGNCMCCRDSAYRSSECSWFGNHEIPYSLDFSKCPKFCQQAHDWDSNEEQLTWTYNRIMALEMFYNTRCFPHDLKEFTNCDPKEKLNNGGLCNIQILRMAHFGTASKQSDFGSPGHCHNSYKYGVGASTNMGVDNKIYYKLNPIIDKLKSFPQKWVSFSFPLQHNYYPCFQVVAPPSDRNAWLGEMFGKGSQMPSTGTYPIYVEEDMINFGFRETINDWDIPWMGLRFSGYGEEFHPDNFGTWARLTGSRHVSTTDRIATEFKTPNGLLVNIPGKSDARKKGSVCYTSAFWNNEPYTKEFLDSKGGKEATKPENLSPMYWDDWKYDSNYQWQYTERSGFRSYDGFKELNKASYDQMNVELTRRPKPRGDDCTTHERKAFFYIIKSMCRYLLTIQKHIAQSNCNNFMYTPEFYGHPYDEKKLSTYARWSLIGATKPDFSAKFNGNIDRIVGEANIIGISISKAAFGSTTDLQFPGGMIINSTHRAIHTRIQRVLTENNAALSQIECNVVRIRTPNIRFENVEFDNAGCQESAMLLAGSHTDAAGLLKNAFKNFKGWNFAPVRLTKSFDSTDPTNIQFVSVRLTAAQIFRKKFPGRPLISVDNVARQKEWTNIEGLYISNAEDTFDYEIDVDVNESIQLAPLDMIMWNYKGTVDFGFFPENWEVVSYAHRGAQDTVQNYYTKASNMIIDYDDCTIMSPIPEGQGFYVFGMAKSVYIEYSESNERKIAENVKGFFHPFERNLLIFPAFYSGILHMATIKITNDDYVNGPKKYSLSTMSQFILNVANVWDNAEVYLSNGEGSDGVISVKAYNLKGLGTFHAPDGILWGQNTNESYCTTYGGENCHYRYDEGRCLANITDTSTYLQILDGNDFFDIAADRFRCFDPVVVDCRTNEILEAVAIVMGGIILMVVTHALGSAYSAFKGIPDCLDIEIDISEVEEDIEKITDT